MDRTRSMKITLKSSPLHGLVPYEGDDDKPDAPEITPAIQKIIDEGIAKATEGLKNTNKALKDEKKALADAQKAMLDQFSTLGGAEGVKKLLEQNAKLRETEEGKLLTEGKHQEWLDLKTAALRKDTENQIKAVRDEATKVATERDAAIGELRTLRLSVDVSKAMAESKVRTDSPGLQDDILAAAEKVFTWDPDRKVMVIKDEDEGVVFGKDGKTPKTVSEWLVEQQESRRHWWGESVSGGAGGSVHLKNMGDNPWSEANWNVTKQGEVVRTRGMDVAQKMAKAAGSHIGAIAPAKKKS
ncbi:MAG TPA: hypothetical protein VFW95_05965 [Candidatus Limnocylindria bacterium]|nr:hypothetical protein [Candidatus Limnocylindria bacterium]